MSVDDDKRGSSSCDQAVGMTTSALKLAHGCGKLLASPIQPGKATKVHSTDEHVLRSLTTSSHSLMIVDTCTCTVTTESDEFQARVVVRGANEDP